MDIYFSYEDGTQTFSCLLGTQSFGFFYPCHGWDMMCDMAEKQPDLIKFVKIVTEHGIQYTVEDFLKLFDGEEALQIRRQT
jgi:hypothetical protein